MHRRSEAPPAPARALACGFIPFPSCSAPRPPPRPSPSQSTDTITDAMLVLSGGGSLPGSHLHSDKMRLDWKASFTRSQIRLLGLKFSLSISQKEVSREWASFCCSLLLIFKSHSHSHPHYPFLTPGRLKQRYKL